MKAFVALPNGHFVAPAAVTAIIPLPASYGLNADHPPRVRVDFGVNGCSALICCATEDEAKAMAETIASDVDKLIEANRSTDENR